MIMKYTSQDFEFTSQFIKHASQYFEYISQDIEHSAKILECTSQDFEHTSQLIFSNKATLHTLLMTATCSFKSGGHMKNNLRM